MSALAIFMCRANSHPFQDRHISAHESVKIGRSVARARPAPNNAIFDCKVLSRNHALLWYENGMFYLQDTKSSNGTFINNQRLSKGSEESPPRELYSGDIVQFGVDVMENSRRITHSCIIASVQLFHPDGREITNHHSSPFLNGASVGTTLQTQELYQLVQCLQEALHREQMMENKLATLQRLIQSTQDASETGWQALIDEDRLLSRLEVLENQLQAYSKNQTEDTLRQELVALQEDKYNYETTAKESLRKVLQEKLEAVRKLSELERSLSNTEDECSHMREMCETSQKELHELAEKHQEQLQEVANLQEKLREAEEKHKEELQNVEKEKRELEAKLEEMEKEENVLQAKVESLQADNDFTKEQLANMKARMEALKEESGESPRIPELESQGVQVELVNLLDLQLLRKCAKESDSEDEGKEGQEKAQKEEGDNQTEEELKVTPTSPAPELTSLQTARQPEKLKEVQDTIDSYKAQLEEAAVRSRESKEEIDRLQDELEQAKTEIASYANKIPLLETKLDMSDLKMKQIADDAVADLKSQLNESKKQAENSTELSKQLRAEISVLEAELKQYRQQDTTSPVILPDDNDVTIMSNHVGTTSPSNDLAAEVVRLKGNLDETRESLEKSTVEIKEVQEELSEAKKQAKEKAAHLHILQDQINKGDTSKTDVKEQVVTLKERLLEEQKKVQLTQQTEDHLRKQLHQSQQVAKQSKNEVEQLKVKMNHLQKELDGSRAAASKAENGSAGASQNEPQSPTPEGGFSSVKEECDKLKRRIQDIECEMKTSRKENGQLQFDYTHLQESYRELEELKDSLENKEMAWKNNLTDAQKDAEQTKRQLVQATEEIERLNERCTKCQEEIVKLQQNIVEVASEFDELSFKSKSISVCSMIPVLILLLAIILGFYPFLSEFTATSADHT